MAKLKLKVTVKVARDKILAAGSIIDASRDDPETKSLVARGFAAWVEAPQAGPKRKVGGRPPASASPKPSLSPDRLDDLGAAIAELAPEEFGSDGKPTVPALTAKLGGPVTEAERDAAWAAVEADQD